MVDVDDVSDLEDDGGQSLDAPVYHDSINPNDTDLSGSRCRSQADRKSSMGVNHGAGEQHQRKPVVSKIAARSRDSSS